LGSSEASSFFRSVVGRLEESVLSAKVLRRSPRFTIAQKSNDLLFRMALLHTSDHFQVKSDSRS
jgi:hypothetical protein